MFSYAQLSIRNRGRRIFDFNCPFWRILFEFTFRPLYLSTDVHTYGLVTKSHNFEINASWSIFMIIANEILPNWPIGDNDGYLSLRHGYNAGSCIYNWINPLVKPWIYPQCRPTQSVMMIVVWYSSDCTKNMFDQFLLSFRHDLVTPHFQHLWPIKNQ